MRFCLIGSDNILLTTQTSSSRVHSVQVKEWQRTLPTCYREHIKSMWKFTAMFKMTINAKRLYNYMCISCLPCSTISIYPSPTLPLVNTQSPRPYHQYVLPSIYTLTVQSVYTHPTISKPHCTWPTSFLLNWIKIRVNSTRQNWIYSQNNAPLISTRQS